MRKLVLYVVFFLVAVGMALPQNFIFDPDARFIWEEDLTEEQRVYTMFGIIAGMRLADRLAYQISVFPGLSEEEVIGAMFVVEQLSNMNRSAIPGKTITDLLDIIDQRLSTDSRAAVGDAIGDIYWESDWLDATGISPQ